MKRKAFNDRLRHTFSGRICHYRKQNRYLRKIDSACYDVARHLTLGDTHLKYQISTKFNFFSFRTKYNERSSVYNSIITHYTTT